MTGSRQRPSRLQRQQRPLAPLEAGVVAAMPVTVLGVGVVVAAMVPWVAVVAAAALLVVVVVV